MFKTSKNNIYPDYYGWYCLFSDAPDKSTRKNKLTPFTRSVQDKIIKIVSKQNAGFSVLLGGMTKCWFWGYTTAMSTDLH